MIRPLTFEVDNHTGMPVDISISPKSVDGEPAFFTVEIDDDAITVTLDCLRDLVKAAEAMLKARGEA